MKWFAHRYFLKVIPLINGLRIHFMILYNLYNPVIPKLRSINIIELVTGTPISTVY